MEYVINPTTPPFFFFFLFKLAQSMARLGSRVTCLERADRLMPREDPDAVAVLMKQLLEDGLRT